MGGRGTAAGLLGCCFPWVIIERVGDAGDVLLGYRLASGLVEGLAAGGEESLTWAIIVRYVWRQGLTVAMFVFDCCCNLG